MDTTMGRMFYVYSSLFISLALNLPRILVPVIRLQTPEIIFQVCVNFIFCLCMFYANKRHFRWLISILILTVFTFITLKLQRYLFTTPGLLPGKGVGFKFLISTILIAIELKMVDTVQLRNAHLKAELGLLKGQLQPHFFFNALSSLSGIVRENPSQAQYYINQLSKVYRYSLQQSENMVSLKEELAATMSYVALLEMRYEKGFVLHVNIPEDKQHLMLPHMSLQPLVENAAKHNVRPLQVNIYTENAWLIVENNIQPVNFPEAGTGIGLANLNERYRILMQEEIVITIVDEKFIVKLPLK